MVRILLLPVSLVWGGILAVRNFLYDIGILPSQSFSLPVINVGNLNFGGSGKTPHIEYLIRLLKEHYQIATLSRGYGRRTSGFILVQSEDATTKVGDEPKQYKVKFSGITVAVDENRRRGIQKLIEQNLAEVILLDDAFQHRRVKPGLNILLTPYQHLFIDDFIAPTGNLREPKSAYKRADIIIVTKVPPFFSPLEKRVIIDKLNPQPYQSVYFSSYEYGDVVSLKSLQKQKTQSIPKEFYFERNFHILLVTGIASSSELVYYIKNQAKKVSHLKFSDHHQYTSHDIKKIKSEFNKIQSDNKIILTTEKDAMRFLHPSIFEQVKELPLFYLPIEVKFHNKDEELFNRQILDYVRNDKIDSAVFKRKN
ncbi:MAG: tetraacyldisaccharide 4'-kinase [Bacteroidetes bacterium]|nr:MAG: tetraacyldisaccharide 4'-kinase [Bacteroidota bacterium]